MASSSDDESNIPTACPEPDLGIRAQQRKNDKEPAGSSHLTGTGTPRNKQNPFSFKYFLKNDLHANPQHTGARPKVYSIPAGNPEPTNSISETNVYPRNPVELPDFVQDHLVMEQCYLNHDSSSQPIVEMENLPDFALNSMEEKPKSWSKDPKKSQLETPGDLSLDLTDSLKRSDRCQGASSASNGSRTKALNLPTIKRRNVEIHGWCRTTGFPFDLQLPPPEVNINIVDGAASTGAQCGEVDVTKSLPDFLNDGPIHNRTGPTIDSHSPSSPEEVQQRLILENERLRREQEITQRQLGEQSRRIQSLQSELISRQSVDHEELTHLEKTIEQVEDNLKRSTRRAVDAEGTVTSLKHEIKALKAEISALRIENEELKLRTDGYSGNNISNRGIKRIAHDLRSAASSAESSLRQLISGVNNLRILASAIDNIDRISDTTNRNLSDEEEDNARDEIRTRTREKDSGEQTIKLDHHLGRTRIRDSRSFSRYILDRQSFVTCSLTDNESSNWISHNQLRSTNYQYDSHHVEDHACTTIFSTLQSNQDCSFDHYSIICERSANW